MSSFFKGKFKGFGKNIFKKPTTSPTTSPSPADKLKTEIEEVQNTINKRNLDGKEPLRKRAYNYLKQIYIDYKEVGKDSIKYMNEHPFKSLGYGLFTTSMVVFYKKNPNKIHYDDKRKEFMNDMIMCGSTFNKRSEFYLNEINKLESTHLIEYKSLIFFSLIMARKFSEFDATYESHCAQLHSPSKYNIFNLPNNFLKFISRIVDIGFCGEWYFLNKYLKDFDVDENEWK